MKLKDIEVGKVYGVRRTRSKYYGTIVPARVVSLNAPYTYRPYKYRADTETAIEGGILVEFIEPTRVGGGFSLAAETNSNAGPVKPHFAFGSRNTPQVGACFVGLWDDILAEREADAKWEREQRDRFDAKADAFVPVLDAYIARLASVGLSVEAYSDGSGLHGDVDLGLYHTDYQHGSRPYAFAYGDVRVPKHIFDQLIALAVDAGLSLDKTEPEEEE